LVGTRGLRQARPDGRGEGLPRREQLVARDRGARARRGGGRHWPRGLVRRSQVARMTGRGRTLVAAITIATALALPAVASAHAVLLHTSPSRGATVKTSPAQVAFTYTEAAGPASAVVSATDAAG